MTNREQTRRDAEVVNEALASIQSSLALGALKRSRDALQAFSRIRVRLEQSERDFEAARLAAVENDNKREQAERERDEARKWLMDFISDEEDVDDRTLAEWLEYVKNWGDQGWWTAGKAEERRGLTEQREAALVEALRYIEWCHDGVEDVCPACGMSEQKGHDRSCKIAAALAVYEQSQGNG